MITLLIEEALDRLPLDPQLLLCDPEFLVGDLDLEHALFERLRWNRGVQLQKFHSLPLCFELLDTSSARPEDGCSPDRSLTPSPSSPTADGSLTGDDERAPAQIDIVDVRRVMCAEMVYAVNIRRKLTG
ncbi:MAG: hypothetical protein H0T99_08675 [Geodermatophilaceae bacterium]|nr:hypothetical protein [Geodermatophilaceae bacterium]